MCRSVLAGSPGVLVLFCQHKPYFSPESINFLLSSTRIKSCGRFSAVQSRCCVVAGIVTYVLSIVRPADATDSYAIELV